jgi:hypothetical protein
MDRYGGLFPRLDEAIADGMDGLREQGRTENLEQLA